MTSDFFIHLCLIYALKTKTTPVLNVKDFNVTKPTAAEQIFPMKVSESWHVIMSHVLLFTTALVSRTSCFWSVIQ